MATQSENTEKKQSYFDLLKDAQSKIADTFNETTSKLVDKALGEETAAGKANDIIVDMLKEQKEIFDELVGQKDVKEAIESSPELLRKWVEAQTLFGRKWVELYHDQSAKYLAGAPQQLREYNDKFLETYTNWEKWVHESITPKEGEEGKSVNLERFTKAYDTLQEYWDKVLGSIKDGIYSKEEFRRLMPLETYEKVTENIMGLQTFDNFKKNQQEINDSFKAYIDRMRDQLGENTDKAIRASLEGVGRGTENIVNFSIDLANRMQETYTPFVKFVTRGNEEVVVEQLEEAREAFHTYNEKATNLQLRVYEASKDGMISTVDTFWKSYQTEGVLPKFDEFASKWMEAVKGQVKTVLDSDEYKALEADFKEAEEKVKENMKKVVDESTKNMPFAKNEEVDALKSEVEALRAELEKMKKEAAKPTATAAKASTSSATKPKSTTRKTAAKK